jgi:hypothetical protein
MELIGRISVVLFIGLILFELLIIVLSKKFRIPPVVAKFMEYLSNSTPQL